MSFPRYSKYKASGVEWLGEVPEGWAVKRLRFVANLNPSKSEISDLHRGTAVSFLPMESVGDDGVLALDKTKSIAELETGYTYFREGDVTIAKITPCYENGKGALMLGLTNGIGFGTTELIVARPIPSQITGTYLHYLFISPDFRGIGESHMYGAGGQKRVPDAFVRNFATAIPPLAEQTAIAAFLDHETAKIDALVAEQERLIELLKEKRQAVISHAVTKGLNPDAPMKDSGIEWLGEVPEHWDVSSLKRMCNVFPSNVDKKSHDGEIPVQLCNYTDVYYNETITAGMDFMSATASADQIAKFTLRAGDVIITKDSEEADDIAIATYVPANLPGVVCGYHLSMIRSMGDVTGIFIKRLFEAGYSKACFEVLAKGLTRVGLGQYELDNVKLPLPPLEEQTAIAAFLDHETAKFTTLTTEANRVIDLLKERRTALISAAVTGQIDVRNLVSVESA